MHITGIIAEYNPFHKGHAHHIQMTRSLGASHIVCVMSGDYVQRGEAAILNKWARAEAAIACGADLVLELPLTFALSPAKRFAFGGIFLLEALGCVETVSFGSESGDISAVSQAARVLALPDTQALLRKNIQQGKSFAAAAELALRSNAPDCAALLTTANDTLGIEYLSALNNLNSSIRALAVKRMEGQVGYRAEILRKLLREGGDIEPFIPKPSYKLLEKERRGGKFLTGLNPYAAIARLCSMSKKDFAELPEVREGLENRLYRAARQSKTMEEFFGKAKTRRFTHASIKRIVMNAMLGISKSDWHENPHYLHILAMGERAPDILRTARQSATLPIIHKASQVRGLGRAAEDMFSLERRAGELWQIFADFA